MFTYYRRKQSENMRVDTRDRMAGLADGVVGLAGGVGRRQEQFAIGTRAQLVHRDALGPAGAGPPRRRRRSPRRQTGQVHRSSVQPQRALAARQTQLRETAGSQLPCRRFQAHSLRRPYFQGTRGRLQPANSTK